MADTRLTPEGCRPLFAAALAGDGADLDLEAYREIFTEIGRLESLSSWLDQGWGHEVWHVGGYYFLNVTELGWTASARSLEDLENREGTARDIDLETCRSALRAEVESGELDLCHYLHLALWLAEPVFEHRWADRGAATTVYGLAGRYITRRMAWDGNEVPEDPLRGTRYAFSRIAGLWHGPFDSLTEAVGGRIHVGPSTASLRCTEWSHREIIQRLWLDHPRPMISINGSLWTGGGLERVQARLRR